MSGLGNRRAEPGESVGMSKHRHRDRFKHLRRDVRNATKEDIAQILELIHAFTEESPWYEEEDVDDEVASTSVVSLIDMGCCFLAFIDEELVGMIAGYVVDDMIRRRRVLAEVLLYVMPEARRFGIAADLIQRFEVWGHGRGARESRIESGAGIAEQKVATLYHRMGYENAGRTFSRMLGGADDPFEDFEDDEGG